MKMLKLLLLLFIAIYFTACGSQKIQTQNNASTVDDADSFQVPADYKIAECNAFNQQGIYGITTNYYMGQNIDFTQVNLRIFNWPTEMTNTDTHKIEFYIWKEDQLGQLSTRSEPVSFYLQNIKNGKFIQQTFKFLSVTAIKKIMSDNNISLSVESFLKDHKIILTGLEKDGKMYHAVTMGVYTTSQTVSSPVKSASFLLPHFPAHPKIYRAQHVNSSLIELHPNYDKMNSSLTDQQYFDITEAYCSDFMK